MTPHDIDQAIEKALAHQSKLTPEVLNVPSFTSHKIKHLLNNLGNLPNLHYFEVGVHKGGTFVATQYQNTLASAVAVDNWSEFAQDGFSRQEFIKYTSTYLMPESFKFFEMNCWQMNKDELPNPVNFYFYDGCHSEESQHKALEYFYDMLDETFLFLVDDYNWPGPQNGTKRALKDMNIEVIHQRELFATKDSDEHGWWNGLYVGLLKKK